MKLATLVLVATGAPVVAGAVFGVIAAAPSRASGIRIVQVGGATTIAASALAQLLVHLLEVSVGHTLLISLPLVGIGTFVIGFGLGRIWKASRP